MQLKVNPTSASLNSHSGKSKNSKICMFVCMCVHVRVCKLSTDDVCKNSTVDHQLSEITGIKEVWILKHALEYYHQTLKLIRKWFVNDNQQIYTQYFDLT
jgi:hypothetical protein